MDQKYFEGVRRGNPQRYNTTDRESKTGGAILPKDSLLNHYVPLVMRNELPLESWLEVAMRIRR